jgi:WD40 repeat protein
MRQLRLPRPVITLSLIVALFAGIGVSSAANEQELSPVWAVEWSPDGTKIALAGGPPTCTKDIDDGFAVYILDANTEQIQQKLSGHSCTLYSIAWSPDGTKLVSSSIDGKAKVWDTQSGKLLSTTKEFTLGRGKVVWSPDGTKIANVWVEDFRFEIFNPTNGEKIRAIGVTGAGVIASVAWSPDGSKIAADSGDDNLIRIWNPSTGQLIASLSGHSAEILDLMWSPDGSKLASSGLDQKLIIWDMSTKQPIKIITADGNIGSLNWNPQGNMIAGGLISPRKAQVWDANSGQVISTIQSNVGTIYNLAWSPDGTQLAYVGENTGLKGENLQIIPAPTSAAPEATSTAEAGGG